MSNSTRSKSAAAARPKQTNKRDHVAAFIVSRGDLDATDHEIHAALGMLPDTVRPRRGELEDLGKITDSRRTRLSPQSHPMTVWVARELWTLRPAIESQFTRSDRCGSNQFIDVQLTHCPHDGQSKRCDCARCGRTMRFPLWYGEVLALKQHRPHRLLSSGRA